MNLQHVNVRFRIDGELKVDLKHFIPVFHRWVAEQSLGGMLIDVVDYRHVPQGPGVVLIGADGDYYMNETGLRYSRKTVAEGTSGEKLKQAFSAAATVCARLEAEFPDLKFCRRTFDVTVNDRAIAPNTPETFGALKSDLEDFARTGLGAGSATLEPEPDPRKLFGVTVTLDRAVDVNPLVLMA